jgi:hypothetical protein
MFRALTADKNSLLLQNMSQQSQDFLASGGKAFCTPGLSQEVWESREARLARAAAVAHLEQVRQARELSQQLWSQVQGEG